MNQGFQQAAQGFGQPADPFGGAMQPYQGAMQPYQGGNPMQGGHLMQGGNAMQGGMPGGPGAMTAGDPPKQFMITLLLALFAGGFGAHRFYTGHILFGVLQLLTVGGCGIWALIDVIMIVTGKYTDAQGRPLAK
jgi:TM2 domain-containing membrane protein YozV